MGKKFTDKLKTGQTIFKSAGQSPIKNDWYNGGV